MSTIEHARQFATIMHAKQQRKYTLDAYIVHPTAVVELLNIFVQPFVPIGTYIDMVCAAWLHDVVEDQGVDLSLIKLHWGSHVHNMVDELTDRSPAKGNRGERKAIDREHLAGASAYSQMIKCADMIDNTRSIALHAPGFAKTYLPEKELLLGIMKPEVQNSMIGRVAVSTMQWGMDYVSKNTSA